MTDTKQKIFYSAQDLFAEVGYRSTSIREIAEKVGIRESSIYNHYPSKEAILSDILETFAKDNKEKFPKKELIEASLTRQTIGECWLLGQRGFHEFINTPQFAKTFRIIMSVQFYNLEAKKVLSDLLEWYIDIIELQLTSMAKRGLIKISKTEIAAKVYVYTILVHLLDYCATGANTSKVEKNIDQFIKHFFSNLKT